MTGEDYGAIKVLLAETLVLANVAMTATVLPDCEVFVTDEGHSRTRSGSPDSHGVVMTGTKALV